MSYSLAEISQELTEELIKPHRIRHVIISPRVRAQRTAELVRDAAIDAFYSKRLIIQMFGPNKPPKCAFTTDPDVAEWDYGKYEGMLTKDIRKENPNWSIWDDGWVVSVR